MSTSSLAARHQTAERQGDAQQVRKSKVAEEAVLCSSPCEDERCVRELLEQRQELLRRTQQQNAVLARLEGSILEYYQTHSIMFEAQNGQTEMAVISPAVESLFSSMGEGEESAESSPPAPLSFATPQTGYILHSEIMQLYRHVVMQERKLSELEAAEERRVIAVEEDIQRDVIDGALATQLKCYESESKVLQGLQHSFDDVEKQCDATAAAIRNAAARLEVVNTAVQACEKRKEGLREQKRQQMLNAENIRGDLAVCRQAVEGAEQNLAQRDKLIDAMQREIERSKSITKRKRRN